MCLSALDILDKLHHFVSLFFSFWIISSTFLNVFVRCPIFFLKLWYNNFYRWCKYCTPPRVRRCNIKHLTLNLVYLIEINLHICIFILTSSGPFFCCCCCCCCCGCCCDTFFWERSFILFRGNFPLYFLIKKIDFFCLFNMFFYFGFFYFYFFSTTYVFFNWRVFFVSLLTSYFFWWNFKMRFSNMKMKQIASKQL